MSAKKLVYNGYSFRLYDVTYGATNEQSSRFDSRLISFVPKYACIYTKRENLEALIN